MTLVPSALAFQFGVGKQTNEATPLATYDYLIPAWSGELAPSQTINPFEVSDSSNIREGHYKQEEHWEGTLELAGFPDSCGQLLAAILGGTDTVTGTGPFTHTIPQTATTATWLTFHQQRPDLSTGLWERFESAQLNSIEIAFAAGMPIKLTVNPIGETITAAGAAPVATTGPPAGIIQVYKNAVAATPSNWLNSVTPTLKLDMATTPASTTRTALQDGKITISRGINFEQTVNITPSYMGFGLFDVQFTATAIWESYSEYRASYYGTSGGTAMTSALATGSLDFTWATGEGTARSLELKIPAINFTWDPPGMDASGAPVKIAVSGALEKPAAGAAVTAVVINDRTQVYQ